MTNSWKQLRPVVLGGKSETVYYMVYGEMKHNIAYSREITRVGLIAMVTGTQRDTQNP